MEKFTKIGANYRNANYDQTKFCKSCKFIDGKNCGRVIGKISYGYVCDLWKFGRYASSPPRTLPKVSNDAI
jgi:hypothetical protein